MSDILSVVKGRTHGRLAPEQDAAAEKALGEFRRAVWRYGFVGLFTGICAGILVAPYSKKLVGVHANVAMPLGLGALFSTFGSAIGAERQSHAVSYALFKRQETLKAVLEDEDERRKIKKEKDVNKKLKMEKESVAVSSLSPIVSHLPSPAFDTALQPFQDPYARPGLDLKGKTW